MIPMQILIATGVSLTIGLLSGWTANGWRLNGRIDQIIAKHSQDLSKATEAAMHESIRLQRKKDEALNEANRIAQVNAKAAASVRIELDRLRRKLATANDLSTASCPSTRDYAATLSAVFGECATRIGELAEKADGHAADSRTLNGAFPK